eukprot:Tbor_TRINITY_DN5554_c0_g1::TRINITY_DN5554_c0_g1_i2::g.12760::m.12760
MSDFIDNKTSGGQVTVNRDHVIADDEKGYMRNIKEANEETTTDTSESKSHQDCESKDDGHSCKESVITVITEEKGSCKGWFKSNYAIFMEEIVKLKWRALILICCIPVGDYYIYDFPSSLGIGKGATIQSKFFDQGKEYSQKMNQSLYSVYSYPNVVLSIIGGILIDSVLGLRLSMLIFSGLVLLGSLVFYLGVQFTSYELIMVGRLIFSLGGETLAVSQNAFLVRWFRGGRGVAFVFGLSIALLRAASSANFFFSTGLSNKYGVAFAALVGTFVCAFSCVCCIALAFVDRYAEKKKLLQSQELGDTEIDEHTGETTKVAFMDRIKTIFLQIRTLPPQHWLLCCICVFLYGANFPFVGFAKNFFETKYHLSSEAAGRTMSIYQITAALACPLAGIVCDKTGRSSYILAITSTSFVLIHLIMIFTYIPPIAAMIIFGAFYSFLVASLWPSVSFVVSQRVTGVSYGVMMSIQAIGSATIPLIVGAILDANLEGKKSGGSDSPSGPAQATLVGYYYAEGVLICLAVISLIFSISLAVVDRKMSGGIISIGAKKRDYIMRLRVEHPDQDLDSNEFYRANRTI